MNTSGYGNTKLIVGWIVSVIVVFIGTLVFAQMTWQYKVGSGKNGTARTVATSQPTSQPASQPAHSSRQAGGAAADGTVDHSTFDRLLKEYVHDERVDYLNLRDNDLAALEAYLDHLATIDIETLSRNEQLAFYTNLYNATMIKAVIDRYEPGYSTSDDDYTVFSDEIVRMKGRTVSLDHLEKQIMLPTFKEPRIHVLVVCGAVSCPPLLTTAYAAENIERLMDANMKRFINDGSRNRIDIANESLQLSQIFNWYADDFGGADKVDDYVNEYYESADVRGFDIEFLEYSWELNIVEPGSDDD